MQQYVLTQSELLLREEKVDEFISQWQEWLKNPEIAQQLLPLIFNYPGKMTKTLQEKLRGPIATSVQKLIKQEDIPLEQRTTLLFFLPPAAIKQAVDSFSPEQLTEALNKPVAVGTLTTCPKSFYKRLVRNGLTHQCAHKSPSPGTGIIKPYCQFPT